MDINRFLPNNEYRAAIGANTPSASNVFATMADVGGGLTTFYTEAVTTTTTSVITDTLVSGMTLTPGAGDYIVMFNTYMSVDSNNSRQTYFSIYLNGIQITGSERAQFTTHIDKKEGLTIILKAVGVLDAQAIEVRWRADNASDVTSAYSRTFNLIKV
jgi:hypothetical protein